MKRVYINSFVTPTLEPRRLASLPAQLTFEQSLAAEEDWSFFEVELFAHLAETAPRALFGPWRVLLELVMADDRFVMHLQPETEGGAQPRMVLDIDALSSAWGELQQRVWLAW